MANAQTRTQAMYWFRKILREAKTWPKPEEAQYMRDEAKRLYRKNKNVSDKEELEAKLFEVEARYELAVHYKIPYPRLYYLQKGSVPDDIVNEITKPIKGKYMHSYE